jgi:hypothetical protein
MAQTDGYLKMLALVWQYNNVRLGNLKNRVFVKACAIRPKKRRVCKQSMVSQFKPGTYRF